MRSGGLVGIRGVRALLAEPLLHPPVALSHLLLELDECFGRACEQAQELRLEASVDCGQRALGKQQQVQVRERLHTKQAGGRG